MDKFRVGQRVRYIKADLLPQMFYMDLDGVGTIATIVGKVVWDDEPFPRWELDNGWNPIEPCLEPVYDGDQPVTWEECAWKPARVSS
jgi:hypothetical protein